jgi:hypothetical protein
VIDTPPAGLPPVPTTLDESREQLRIAGWTIRQNLEAQEANAAAWGLDDAQIKRAHFWLDRGGYTLESADGVADGYYGAGGSNKPPN